MNAASSSLEAPSSSSSGSGGDRDYGHHNPDGPAQSHNGHDDVDEEADLLDTDTRGIFDDDPLRAGELEQPLSFKRKQKQGILSGPSRLLTALAGGRDRNQQQYHQQQQHAGLDSPPWTPLADSDSPPTEGGSWPDGTHPEAGRAEGIRLNPAGPNKDGVPLDWYVEGPGRRVGYGDLTAIDWIFEYTKERQRLRILSSGATGLMGYIRQQLDASQVWVILVLTGLAVGAVAAGIDIVTNWLGDLKGGYCTSADGGAFYLNRAFCCLGYDDFSKCTRWRAWGASVGIRSAEGRWFMEYFFFTLFSVRIPMPPALLPHIMHPSPLFSNIKYRSHLLFAPVSS